MVLTDGANTQGVDPVTAAQQAAARHLRVYTIGFGTTEPAAVRVYRRPDQWRRPVPWRPRRQRFGGGGGGRGGQEIDEDALDQVAAITGGKYFQAKDAKELTDALIDLPSSIVLQRKHAEITVWFALAGALLVLVAVGLTQWWSRPRPAPTRPH